MNFGKKLLARIENPLSAGSITESPEMRLAIAESHCEQGTVRLYLLVDKSDGIIADAKVQLYGPPALIGAAESACALALRKNYEQAKRLSADLLDKEMRDRGEESAFPKEAAWALNLVLDALDAAASQCMDIPIVDGYVAPPMEIEDGEEQEYPGWDQLSVKQKITVIEEVIAREIRPYVELDAGGVRVIDLLDTREVVIAYEGSCTTCHSATGATLSAIQQILRTKIHPELLVTPRFDGV